MPGNIQHESVGTTLTQAEYEVADGGVIQFASQATGDIPYASSATVIEGLAIGSANQLLTVSGGIPAWTSNVTVPGTLSVTGKAFINDSANASMTLGLTINQGANDDEILSLKSSDVAHALLIASETDTYYAITKDSATVGSTQIKYIAEDDASTAVVARHIVYGGQASTTKTTAGRALYQIDVHEHDGANARANITADGNIFGVSAWVGGALTARYLLDEDGDTWQDGGAIFNDVVFINDTANTGMTMGLTINQGGNDDDILAFKSSDVSHPLTGVTEADTYGRVKKVGATTGGLEIAGFTTAGLNSGGVTLLGITGTAADTTDTTSSGAVIELIGRDTDGATGGDNIGATGNVVTIQNNATTLLLVKGNGDLHATNVTGGQLDGTALDTYDDPALVRVWQSQGGEAAGVIRDEWDRFVKYNENDLRDAGILGSDGTMFNMSQLLRLFGGAIWQQQKRILSIEQDLRSRVLPEGN